LYENEVKLENRRGADAFEQNTLNPLTALGVVIRIVAVTLMGTPRWVESRLVDKAWPFFSATMCSTSRNGRGSVKLDDWWNYRDH